MHAKIDAKRLYRSENIVESFFLLGTTLFLSTLYITFTFGAGSQSAQHWQYQFGPMNKPTKINYLKQLNWCIELSHVDKVFFLLLFIIIMIMTMTIIITIIIIISFAHKNAKKTIQVELKLNRTVLIAAFDRIRIKHMFAIFNVYLMFKNEK